MSRKTIIPLALVACMFPISCMQEQRNETMARPRKSFKYMVQGPWNIGDPVHETLTLLSIRTAIQQHASTGNLLEGVALSSLPTWDSKTAHAMTASNAHRSLHQFLRGVIWPDDPEGLFFNNKKDVYNFSTGFKWRAAFKADPTNRNNVIARTHFGDLQYFHSMSPTTSMPKSAVRDKMLQWAGFLVDVSTGKIKPDDSLTSTPAIAGLFPNRSTARNILVADSSSADIHIRQRAVGALLHMIQDSYCPGHTKRNSNGGILSFECYNDPNHNRHEHALADTWGFGTTLRQRVNNTPGAATAVVKGSRLLALINAGKPKTEIMRFIRTDVLNLAP